MACRNVGKDERVNVEYVSANPTGPMHMGHCRGAVVGDSLARLLEAAGFRVTKEYYVNDAGAQVDTLARSVHLRYREALGEEIGEIPEGLYPGDYLKPVGDVLAAEYGDDMVEAPESEWLPVFREAAIAAMLDLIRHDLGLLGIHHDIFASEAELQRSGAVDRGAWRCCATRGWSTKATLERPKSLDPHDEWEPVELTLFRSTQFGDDQDRPMKKSDGSWTYFGADAAYHWQKAQNADHLVNIWGADHAGTVKRVQAAVKALTDGRVDLDVKLVQMVRLFRGGEPVKMSQARRRLRHARRRRERGRQGRRPLHDADPPRRRAARLRLRQGGRGVEGQSGLLRPICPCPDQLAEAQGGRGGCGPRERQPTCRCSTTRSSRWSSARRNIRACSKARRWRTSRTASPSISTISRPSSTRCGTAATTIRSGASWLKTIHNFLARGWNWRWASGRSSGAASR